MTVKRSGVDYEERHTRSEDNESQAERQSSSQGDEKTSQERHNDDSDCDEESTNCHKNFEKTLRSSSQHQHISEHRGIYA